MNHPFKNGIQRKSAHVWTVLACTVCAVMLLLTSCITQAPHATVDDVAALKKELSDAASEIDTLKEGYTASQLELEALKARDEATQGEIDALKGQNEAAKEEIDALKGQNEAAKEEIDALKGQNEAAKEEIDALKGQNEAAKEEIDALKGQNEVAKEEIDALKGQSAAMQQEIDALKAQLEALQNAMPAPPSGKIRIYIDQGHNPTSYHNSGASGNGLYEQDLTFEIGCMLAELLQADGRFEIRLSRPTADTVLGTDNNSSLDARVQGAQEFGADYFISLHINSYTDAAANGIEVYVAEENSISYSFASRLLQGMLDTTGLKDRGVKLNPELRVLKNATMPATLLEMGFISNAGDAALLAESPDLFTQGIYDGILAYFGLTAPSASAD